MLISMTYFLTPRYFSAIWEAMRLEHQIYNMMWNSKIQVEDVLWSIKWYVNVRIVSTVILNKFETTVYYSDVRPSTSPPSSTVWCQSRSTACLAAFEPPAILYFPSAQFQPLDNATSTHPRSANDVCRLNQLKLNVDFSKAWRSLFLARCSPIMEQFPDPTSWDIIAPVWARWRTCSHPLIMLLNAETTVPLSHQ